VVFKTLLVIVKLTKLVIKTGSEGDEVEENEHPDDKCCFELKDD